MEFVSRNPEWPDTPRLDMPVWELITRNLFDISQSEDMSKGIMIKRTRAQKVILNRMTGTRRTGTAPAIRNAKEVIIYDLAAGHAGHEEAQEQEASPVEVTL